MLAMRMPVSLLLLVSAATQSHGFRVSKSAQKAGSCQWRQTGQCSVDGPREPHNDKTCDSSITDGHSGFCDCNGNNVLDPDETGFGCSGTDRGTCNDICQAAMSCTVTRNAAIPGYNNEHLTGQTVLSCTSACLSASWGCKSFDWHKNTNECDLSSKSAADVGGLKTTYSGNPYDHYDCTEVPAPMPTPAPTPALSRRRSRRRAPRYAPGSDIPKVSMNATTTGTNEKDRKWINPKTGTCQQRRHWCQSNSMCCGGFCCFIPGGFNGNKQGICGSFEEVYNSGYHAFFLKGKGCATEEDAGAPPTRRRRATRVELEAMEEARHESGQLGKR